MSNATEKKASEALLNKAILQKYLAQIVADGVPGVSVALSTATETMVATAGTLEVGGNDTLTEQSHFDISCLGKTLVATAVLQLVECGRLNLDTPIVDYFPEFQANPDSKANFIKLRHLLSHTGGYLGLDRTDRMIWGMSGEDGLQFFENTAQLFTPGAVFSEEPLDYALLGLIVRKVTGQDVFDFIQKNIFLPLGLCPGVKGSSLAVRPSFVSGHNFSAEIKKFVKNDDGWANEFWAPAASNITMTTGDIAVLGRELTGDLSRGNSNAFFSTALLRMLREPVVKLPRTISVWQHPEWMASAFGLGYAEFQNGCYGLFSGGRGQSSALVSYNDAKLSIAIAFSIMSSPLRSRLLNFISRWLSGETIDYFREAPYFPTPNIGFDEFLNGFTPEQLAGSYSGPGEDLVKVEAGTGRMRISIGEDVRIILGALQRGRLMVETQVSLAFGFFADPSGNPALMLGMAVYRKL